MVELGFSADTITYALEHFDWDFSLALTFLLYGQEDHNALRNQMSRHISKKAAPATPDHAEDCLQQPELRGME